MIDPRRRRPVSRSSVSGTSVSRNSGARARLLAAGLALLLFVAAAALSAGVGDDPPADDRSAVIRILPPREQPVTGKIKIETLLIDPAIRTVELSVDGASSKKIKFAPWDARLDFASPPREQIVRAVALDEAGRELGVDELVVNRIERPLRIDIRSLEEGAGSVGVVAAVSLPDGVALSSGSVFLGDQRAATFVPADLADGRLELQVERPGPARPDDFVRVEAVLADGRRIEDVELIAARGFEEELDVRLVQLQVLVTDRAGRPLQGLGPESFTIHERGKRQPTRPAGVFPAEDVSLLLGLAMDSSGSMQSIWPTTRQAADLFLERTLSSRDQGFLVDFDTEFRLVQARTGDESELRSGLERIEPDGGTALYDSILFSLLQFERQQGRRGLVVLTDGFDIDSKADPQRTIEFGRRLGVPVYVVAIENRSPAAGIAGRGGQRGAFPGQSGGPAFRSANSSLQSLKLLTEPTGGRLFRVVSADQVANAFAQIDTELRSQYVLTYYTDTPPEPGEPPTVEVAVDGKKVRVKTVFGSDQIY